MTWSHKYHRPELYPGQGQKRGRPKEKDLTPLYDFINSGWKNVYSTLSCVEKRALWRSVIDYMEVDVLTKEFDIKFI